jgi:hypothetical protein
MAEMLLYSRPSELVIIELGYRQLKLTAMNRARLLSGKTNDNE